MTEIPLLITNTIGFAVSISNAYLGLALASAWLNCVFNQDQYTCCCSFLGEDLDIVRELPFLKIAYVHRLQNEEGKLKF